jgi:type I restriction enzyme S subunit
MANEWGEIQLSCIAKLRSGFPFKSSSWVDDGVPVIKIANVKDGRIVADGCGYVSHETAATVREWMTQKGDVLIAMTGYVGEIALVRSGEKYLINQRVGRFDFLDDSPVIPEFFFYYLRQSEVRSLLETMARGSAQPNLSASDAAKLCVPVPPLAEQRRIASILGNLDDQIENNRKMAKTLEAMAQAIFQSWFVDFDPVRAKMAGESREDICKRLKITPEILDLFPDRLVDSELGEIPEGWVVLTIGKIADISSGKRPAYRYERSSDNANIPLWGGNGKIGFVSDTLIAEPVILTGRVGTIGTFFRVETACWPSDNTLVIKPIKKDYFEYLYSSLLLIDIASLNRGSTQPLLTQSDLIAQPIIIPQFKVINKFHSIA